MKNVLHATPSLVIFSYVAKHRPGKYLNNPFFKELFISELKNKTQKKTVNIHNNTNNIDNFNPIILMKGELLFVSCY